MTTLKPHYWHYWRRSTLAIQDKSINYWGAASLRILIILLLLTTGSLITPAVLMAAPNTDTKDAGGAPFNITWSLSCQPPPTEAVTALDHAATLWGTWISSTVPIEVTACWTSNLNCSGDALACGGPGGYSGNFANASLVNTQYPAALANALSGQDLNPSRADINLQFKANVAWSFATTARHLTVPSAGEDFVAVALHEIAHGLGYTGNMYEDYNIGFCGDGPMGYLYPCPTVYDHFVVDSTGIALLGYLTPDPRELGSRLKSDANFGGPNSVAANSNATAKLYTPATWQPGSSLSHLDQTVFASGANRLMTPSYNGVTRHPGQVTLAMFQDMGWLRADGTPNASTSGPLVLGKGSNATFTGKLIWSSYTGQPVTYVWSVSDFSPVTHPGLGETDSINRTWTTPGTKTLKLTVKDGTITTYATRTALIFDVDANGLTQGETNHAYTFDANITPGSGGFPITYTWKATDLTPVVHPEKYVTDDSIAFSWTTPGTKTITITAAIAGSTATSVHKIVIEEKILDKLIFLPTVLRLP